MRRKLVLNLFLLSSFLLYVKSYAPSIHFISLFCDVQLCNLYISIKTAMLSNILTLL